MTKPASAHVSLPPVAKIIDYLRSRTGPATVSQIGHRFTHISTAALRSYLRRLAAAGTLTESKNDSDTLQFSVPATVSGLDALYRPVLPTRYTVRRVIGDMGPRG